MRLCLFFVPGLLGVLAVASLTLAAAQRGPRISVDAAGRLTVSGLPSILGDEEVKRYLDSGLTTSLVFQARPQGSIKAGAARVDIRFELWDEVYLVTVIDGEGEFENARYDSIEALSKWWSDVEIVLSKSAADSGDVGSQAKVSLAVVPFSQAELVDTQKWLTESIGQAQGGSRVGREGGASQAVGALIATSMQRRAVRSMTWSLPIAQRDIP